MTRIANPFRYSIRQAPDGGRYGSISCIMKLWFGEKKFFIWKSKSLHQTVNTFSIEIDQRLRLGLKGPDDIYKNIVAYINRARVTHFEVEPVFTNDNPVELLKEEYRLLQANKKNENCLNTKFDPYLPKWIPQTAITEFYKYRTELQKAAKQRAAEAKKKRNAKAKPKNNKVRSTRRSVRKKGSVRNRKRGGSGIRRKA